LKTVQKKRSEGRGRRNQPLLDAIRQICPVALVFGKPVSSIFRHLGIQRAMQGSAKPCLAGAQCGIRLHI
jgi:hypothetical protein